MDTLEKTQRLRIEEALSARLELLSGGVSGAATYLVYGLSESCVLKVVAAESPDPVRSRGQREIHFYNELAPHIPLHTPRVLASLIEESGYCALLLEAYAPMKPASELSDAEFAEITQQLASFHALYWNRTERLNDFSWIEKPKRVDLTHDARHASETWQTLAQQPQFRELLTDSSLRDIEVALDEVRTKPEYGPEIPMTLCHGDCHLENLLRDRENLLIWADWQEVRMGHGPSDLTFLMQRAEANGADIAHDMIVTAYCKALEVAGVKDINETAVKSAMRESEWRTRLLYWPDYMRDATSETMANHLTRIFSV
jgi:thiamine kinase-like enzyme